MRWRALGGLAVVAAVVALWVEARPGSSAAGDRSDRSSVPNASAEPTLAPSIDGRTGEAAEPGAGPVVASALDVDPGWEAGESALGWDRWLSDVVRPRQGESLIEYRDRLVPIARTLVAPERRRVARVRESFLDLAELDGPARGRVDEIIATAQSDIMSRASEAIFGGELLGADVRPMAGVRFARDVLNRVVAADNELRASLDRGGAAALVESRFDLAEYLLIATRWEALVGVD